MQNKCRLNFCSMAKKLATTTNAFQEQVRERMRDKWRRLRFNQFKYQSLTHNNIIFIPLSIIHIKLGQAFIKSHQIRYNRV